MYPGAAAGGARAARCKGNIGGGIAKTTWLAVAGAEFVARLFCEGAISAADDPKRCAGRLGSRVKKNQYWSIYKVRS